MCQCTLHVKNYNILGWILFFLEITTKFFFISDLRNNFIIQKCTILHAAYIVTSDLILSLHDHSQPPHFNQRLKYMCKRTFSPCNRVTTSLQHFFNFFHWGSDNNRFSYFQKVTREVHMYKKVKSSRS